MKDTEVLPGVFVNPRTIETEKGIIEYHITEGDGPVVLVSHGGIGGVDQARVLGDWIDEARYRVLCPSRPGYLGTPLESGKTFEEQADLFAALLKALGIDKAAVVAASAGGPPGLHVRCPPSGTCMGAYRHRRCERLL